MIKVSQNILSQLEGVLLTLSSDNYKQSLEIFSGASVGQHTRHILEFYLCLIKNYNCDKVNYDLRKRDTKIEGDLEFAISQIIHIKDKLSFLTEDKSIKLEALMGGKNVIVDTTFNRELLYAVEHTVHHMAIIKMGISLNFPQVVIPQNFGVAESTIQYKSSCAQ